MFVLVLTIAGVLLITIKEIVELSPASIGKVLERRFKLATIFISFAIAILLSYTIYRDNQASSRASEYDALENIQIIAYSMFVSFDRLLSKSEATEAISTLFINFGIDAPPLLNDHTELISFDTTRSLQYGIGDNQEYPVIVQLSTENFNINKDYGLDNINSSEEIKKAHGELVVSYTDAPESTKYNGVFVSIISSGSCLPSTIDALKSLSMMLISIDEKFQPTVLDLSIHLIDGHTIGVRNESFSSLLADGRWNFGISGSNMRSHLKRNYISGLWGGILLHNENLILQCNKRDLQAASEALDSD